MTSDLAKKLFEAHGDEIRWIINSGSSVKVGDRADLLNAASTKRTVQYNGRKYAAPTIRRLLSI